MSGCLLLMSLLTIVIVKSVPTIVYFGGFTQSGKGPATTAVITYPANQILAHMNTPRAAMAFAVLNNNVYVFGGRSTTDTALTTSEMYTTAKNTWSMLPNMRLSRMYAFAVATANSIIVVGGVSNLNSPLILLMEQFDGNKWTTLNILPSTFKAPGGGKTILGYAGIIGVAWSDPFLTVIGWNLNYDIIATVFNNENGEMATAVMGNAPYSGTVCGYGGSISCMNSYVVPSTSISLIQLIDTKLSTTYYYATGYAPNGDLLTTNQLSPGQFFAEINYHYPGTLPCVSCVAVVLNDNVYLKDDAATRVILRSQVHPAAGPCVHIMNLTTKSWTPAATCPTEQTTSSGAVVIDVPPMTHQVSADAPEISSTAAIIIGVVSGVAFISVALYVHAKWKKNRVYNFVPIAEPTE